MQDGFLCPHWNREQGYYFRDFLVLEIWKKEKTMLLRTPDNAR